MPATSTGEIEVRVLERLDWHCVEELFGPRGACGGCWCMAWRVPHMGKLWQSVKGEPNRRSLKKLVESGEQHAVLAFSGDLPIGWCSFGPRSTFVRLESMRSLRRDWGEGTWSVVCFYIHPKWRHKGVASRLLAAATRRAFELGAHEVEGFPAKPTKGQLPGAFAWTGLPAMFENEGYTRLKHTAGVRPIYLKTSG